MSSRGPQRTGWPGFFVVGTGRCGSSMVRRLLRGHPDVHIPQETHWIPILHDFFGETEIGAEEFFTTIRSVYMAKGKTAFARVMKQDGLDPERFEAEFSAIIEALPRRRVADIMDAFYVELARRQGASLWGDKTPDYGLCMGLLQRMWPSAKFLHVVRDGRDVALSMSEVLSFRLQAAWRICYWPTVAWEKAYAARLPEAEAEIPMHAFFDLWRRRLVRTRDEASRLPPGSYLEIRYEDLLEAPHPTLDRAASFLGLPAAAGWVEQTVAQVRGDNRKKNSERPEYQELTRRHGEILESLGFGH